MCVVFAEDGDAFDCFVEGFAVDGAVEEVFDTGGGAGLVGGEGEGLEGDVVAGGDVLFDGFTVKEGVCMGGEEGHVDATCGE